jgi:hypothetical protein
MKLKYKDIPKKAEHLKALGINDIWLEWFEELPWDLVIDCNAGMHRLGMISSVSFRAYEPKLDLYFRWTVDLEEKEANGMSLPVFNMANYRFIIDHLDDEMTRKFRRLVKDGLKEVRFSLISWRNETTKSIDYCNELLETFGIR